ncbi:hypothetical protein EXIGLDRAFT_692108 [Exidia glandulosa HHB12029]|uniref:Uncharacterized protein n=1 Tax=Exidia glandulosa HHB12029 TaxID=1314781 RepID=A0A166MMN3_EXIGL|nr:hypothetical protein EXIGLDRAFT_692108 [Exidia glandulosa HHB12029]
MFSESAQSSLAIPLPPYSAFSLGRIPFTYSSPLFAASTASSLRYNLACLGFPGSSSTLPEILQSPPPLSSRLIPPSHACLPSATAVMNCPVENPHLVRIVHRTNLYQPPHSPDNADLVHWLSWSYPSHQVTVHQEDFSARDRTQGLCDSDGTSASSKRRPRIRAAPRNFARGALYSTLLNCGATALPTAKDPP